MNKFGVFDIIGPIMIGPSSSHTAGAVRLGSMARLLSEGEISGVTFQLHGSFAKTCKGHGTDKALLAGILNLMQDDERLKQSFEIAHQRNIKYVFEEKDLGDVHPNTVRFVITTVNSAVFTMVGSSIGGGKVVITSIDDIEVNFSGHKPILITKHEDVPGVIFSLTSLLYKQNLNIGNMRVNRREPNGQAYMYMELDQKLSKEILAGVKEIPGVKNVILLKSEIM